MFIEWKHLKCGDKGVCDYEIIDDDFKSIVSGSSIEDLIIQEYEKRNLNVPANAAKVISWLNGKYGSQTVKIRLQSFMYSLAWDSKYKEDIEKYLLLM